MTTQEKVIATAFTGITFVEGDEFGEFVKYISNKLGFSVYTHHLADEKLWDKLKPLVKQDFIDMLHGKYEAHQ